MKITAPLANEQERNDFIKGQTFTRRSYIADLLQTARDVEQDAFRSNRHRQRLCRFDFNRSSIAGQAFTEYTCVFCGREGTWHNTAVPVACNDCSIAYNICIECGGKLDL